MGKTWLLLLILTLLHLLANPSWAGREFPGLWSPNYLTEKQLLNSKPQDPLVLQTYGQLNQMEMTLNGLLEVEAQEATVMSTKLKGPILQDLQRQSIQLSYGLEQWTKNYFMLQNRLYSGKEGPKEPIKTIQDAQKTEQQLKRAYNILWMMERFDQPVAEQKPALNVPTTKEGVSHETDKQFNQPVAEQKLSLNVPTTKGGFSHETDKQLVDEMNLVVVDLEKIMQTARGFQSSTLNLVLNGIKHVAQSNKLVSSPTLDYLEKLQNDVSGLPEKFAAVGKEMPEDLKKKMDEVIGKANTVKDKIEHRRNTYSKMERELELYFSMN